MFELNLERKIRRCANQVQMCIVLSLRILRIVGADVGINRKGSRRELYNGFIRDLIFLLTLLMGPVVLASGNRTSQEPNELVYYSDYFSFIGADQHGRVCFALDNNRGQDDDKFQAEHFSVLYEQGKGWHKIKGNGSYPNNKKELKNIPNSEFFQFEGNNTSGFTIASQVNKLSLTTDPIPHILSKENEGSKFWMGSAKAVLKWNGRTLVGRVIYEYLYWPNFNRLSRSYPDLWQEFHGLYLTVENDDDFYFHTQESPLTAKVVGHKAGFQVVAGQRAILENLNIQVVDKKSSGSYSWPVKWQGTWGNDSDKWSFEFESSETNVISNWGTGGFSMGIVNGILKHKNKTYKVFGFSELLI